MSIQRGYFLAVGTSFSFPLSDTPLSRVEGHWGGLDGYVWHPLPDLRQSLVGVHQRKLKGFKSIPKPSQSGWSKRVLEIEIACFSQSHSVLSSCPRGHHGPSQSVYLKAWVFGRASYCLPSLGSAGPPEDCSWCLAGWKWLKAGVEGTRALVLERAATVASSSGGAAAYCPSLPTAGCSVHF